jgi:3D (Asp-Asp-Asp) domain-containing protein
MSRTRLRTVLIAFVSAAAASGPQPAYAAAGASGAAIAAPTRPATAPTSATATPVPPAASGKWIHGVTLTEYWPVPESWFTGALVQAPGLTSKHRIDWLYSAQGVSMEGEGLGLDGRMYHIDSLGSGGWVTAAGRVTIAAKNWLGGTPYWRAGGFWANAARAVTYPLLGGGWSNGTGRRYVPLPGVTFASGPSLPLRFYQSIAVDPKLIPLGSRVYIPAYKTDGHGGWFVAQDTGGAIKGRHVDVYRTPPASPNDGGNYASGAAIYIVPPAG